MKSKAKININDLGATLEDWLSPTEKNQLIKALKSSKGWTFLTIVKNFNKFKDYYYIDGEEIFNREIK